MHPKRLANQMSRPGFYDRSLHHPFNHELFQEIQALAWSHGEDPIRFIQVLANEGLVHRALVASRNSKRKEKPHNDKHKNETIQRDVKPKGVSNSNRPRV